MSSAIFILSEFIQQIPTDLRDAARCDGVPETRIFLEVIAPLLRPRHRDCRRLHRRADLERPLVSADPDVERLDAYGHARRAAVSRPIHHRLEFRARRAVDGDPAGRRDLRDPLAPAHRGPHLRRSQIGFLRMANLRIEHLNKRYGTATVLSDVNLNIEDGEFVVLVGPSGCGKSTLLRMIAGLDGASGGDIHIASKLVNTLAPAERGIAMVFQSYALYPHM